MRKTYSYWKKRTHNALLAAGFLTMLAATWSMFEPGYHRGRQLIMGIAQNSIPVHYIPEPAILKIPEIKDVVLVGCWPRIQGDDNMDTGPGDYAPVRCTTNIYIDGEKVMLKVFYRIEEHGGDRTIYCGARTMVLFENTRREYTIRTVELRGSRLNTFMLYSEGAQLDFRTFDVSDSYWEKLEYRIDSKDDDDRLVGIRGRLALNVILESTRAVSPVGIRQI